MRCLSLVLAALLFAPSTLAQTYAIDKASYLLGGSVSLTSRGDDDDEGNRLTALTINPNFAYFVAPGLALGGQALLSRQSLSGQTRTSYSLGPEISYYFGSAATTTYPFLAAGVSYVDRDQGSRRSSGFSADLTGGMVFMVARNVGLTAEAFYEVLSLSNGGSMDTFGLRGGVTAFIF